MNNKIVRLLGASGLTMAGGLAHAAGYALIEQSASGMGNAYAGGAAAAEDASTIYFNPAGMMRLEPRAQALAALHWISPKAEFTDQGSHKHAAAGGSALTGNDDGGVDALVPNFYYVMPLSDTTRFGLGINAPFGLSTEYNKSWAGRYHAIESSLMSININPSFAVQMTERLAFGFGFNFQYVDVTLSSAIDQQTLTLALPPHLRVTEDGYATLTGDNFDRLNTGVNAGLLYQATDATRLGMAYRSRIKHHVDGEADFDVSPILAASGRFVDTGLKASVTVPATLSLSVYHAFNDRWALMADATKTYWSVFKELRIEYDNPLQPDTVTTADWDNSWRYALGVNYQLNDQWLLRAGAALDQSPIPNAEHRTPRIPDSDRRWLAIGASYKSSERLSFDVGYAHLFVSDTKINNTLEVKPPFDALNATLKGEYESSVDILSVQGQWLF
ncbi:MAG: outer membrane protein transport protein [Pseudomonadota bacterium]